jgi:hypothetical protein
MVSKRADRGRRRAVSEKESLTRRPLVVKRGRFFILRAPVLSGKEGPEKGRGARLKIEKKGMVLFGSLRFKEV